MTIGNLSVRRFVFYCLLGGIVLWLIYFNAFYPKTQNKPVRVRTEYSQTFLLGRIAFFTYGKEKRYYNRLGQITQVDKYNYVGDVSSRELYSYNAIDSVSRYLTFYGTDLEWSQEIRYEYNSHHDPSRSIRRSNHYEKDTVIYSIDEYFYDTLNRLERTRSTFFSDDTTVHETTNRYDRNGRKIEQDYQALPPADPGLTVTKFFYKDDGKLELVVDSEGDSTFFTYEEHGWVTEVRHSQNGFEGYNEKNSYDARGNLVRVSTGADSESIRDYVYDENNRLIMEFGGWTQYYLFRSGSRYEYEYYDP